MADCPISENDLLMDSPPVHKNLIFVCESIDWANSVSGIFYNMTTLKEVYGDSFTEADLPKTTNELLDMSYDVSAKDGYVAWSTFAGSSYSDYMTTIWGAQYDTVQGYFDYYDLIYRDENGEPHVADTYDQIDSVGRLEAFKVIAEILNKNNGLMHPAIDSMSYLDAQVAFAGNGFKGNNDKVAFIPSGDWMENELADYLPNNPQDFGILKSPVISSIMNTFTDAEDKTYFSDATEAEGTYGRKTTVGDQRLSQLVTCIDENKTFEETRTALGYQDLDQVTYDRVAEARAVMSCATMDHQMSVPNTSKNKENAFDFILYMLSDDGQDIYSEALGGRGMVYGYEPDTSNSSYMIQSIKDLGNYLPVFTDYASPYVYLGGLRYFAVNDRYTQMCNGVTAETVNDAVIQHWPENWTTVKEAGKVA